MLLVAWFFIMGAHSTAISDEVIEKTIEPWTGDFDGMLERRQIRVLVVYNKLMYFIDGARQRGAVFDGMEEFRQFIDKKYDLGSRKMSIVYIPVTRDRLIPALIEGIGDIAAANLTITPDRLEQVDFSNPTVSDVKEVLVTGPESPAIDSIDDLSAKEIHVRLSSSYYQSLARLNDNFASQGKEPVQLIPIAEHLEDGDLLEMVNAGLLPMLIVDNHKAEFWADVFGNLTIHDAIFVNDGQKIGWAMRKNSPALQAVTNEFVATAKKGTLLGNIILKRYLKDNKWVRNSLDKSSVERYHELRSLFQTYGDRFDIDWLLLVSQGYQESQLDNSARSAAGAVGIMQLLPSTAADPNVDIDNVEQLENNIHAGAKYLRFIRDRYFSDPEINPVNQTLLSFAAYNAGPASVARLRKEASESGLDPNVWFGNVEHMAARRIGREPVQYVSNIYKYFIAYSLLKERSSERNTATESLIQELD